MERGLWEIERWGGTFGSSKREETERLEMGRCFENREKRCTESCGDSQQFILLDNEHGSWAAEVLPSGILFGNKYAQMEAREETNGVKLDLSRHDEQKPSQKCVKCAAAV